MVGVLVASTDQRARGGKSNELVVGVGVAMLANLCLQLRNVLNKKLMATPTPTLSSLGGAEKGSEVTGGANLTEGTNLTEGRGGAEGKGGAEGRGGAEGAAPVPPPPPPSPLELLLTTMSAGLPLHLALQVSLTLTPTLTPTLTLTLTLTLTPAPRATGVCRLLCCAAAAPSRGEPLCSLRRCTRAVAAGAASVLCRLPGELVSG